MAEGTEKIESVALSTETMPESRIASVVGSQSRLPEQNCS